MRGYIGIDPGIAVASPGCAAILIDGGSFQLYEWKSEKSAYRALDGWRSAFEVKAALEQIPLVSSPKLFPSMKLAANYGFWIGLLTALDIEFKLIPVTKWQARMLMKVTGKDTKQLSFETACEIIPGANKYLKSKYRHHGRADALLIAKYLQHDCEFRRTIGSNKLT